VSGIWGNSDVRRNQPNIKCKILTNTIQFLPKLEERKETKRCFESCKKGSILGVGSIRENCENNEIIPNWVLQLLDGFAKTLEGIL
jgi:hypothetical protein